ncbi:MAG TPA: hypothetical protein DCS43_10710 [Verrucomicrobia bacterium]|nr:hypothetical protein [Verrucomicrobiota bacterium]
MFKLIRHSDESVSRRVCVVGIGDGGSRAVAGVLGGGSGEGCTIAVINVDPVALENSKAMTKVLIGRHGPADGGAGGDPAVGKAAAERDIEMIHGLLSDCDVLIMAVALGGGTGTGAAPVVLAAAREAGILTLVMTTTPFAFEGEFRNRIAREGLQTVTAMADFVSVIPNDRLVSGVGSEGGMAALFARADEILAAGICSLWQMVAKPMLIGVDAGGLRALAGKGSGACLFGFGTASGVGRGLHAVKALLEGPVLEKGASLRSCGAALVCVAGSYDMTLHEVGDAFSAVCGALPADCDIQVGTVVNEGWDDRILITVYVADRRRTVTPAPRAGGGRRTEPAAPMPASGSRSKAKTAAQGELMFDAPAGSRGRFVNIPATILDGEDLDTPTFKRRGIVLEK